MIVKNEEANLPACLESVRGLFDEIIIVDTGSTDRTKEIAAAFGAKVFEFTWVDSFAAARNECLRHATGNWIFWMDADDRLDEANRQKLLALFANLDKKTTAFVMRCVCPPAADTGIATEVQHVRLFRNHSQIRWEHRVHEQILPAVRRVGREVRFTDVAIAHTGYLDAEVCYLQLLAGPEAAHLASVPIGLNGYITRHNLAVLYHQQGRLAEAETQWRAAVEKKPDFVQAWLGLEELYVSQGRWMELEWVA